MNTRKMIVLTVLMLVTVGQTVKISPGDLILLVIVKMVKQSVYCINLEFYIGKS